jgi:3-hydroxyisobutyrate dehydrogenase-like beta-hydroxyacid dehydrogenase
VYNRRPSKAARLVEQGAHLAEQAAQVAEPGGIVLTMLADDQAVEEVCFAKPSFVERLGKGGTHISLSAISPDTARHLAGFRLALGLKDIDLILRTAAKSVTPLPLASLLDDRWLSSMATGGENLDWSAILLDVAEQAGITTMAAAS